MSSPRNISKCTRLRGLNSKSFSSKARIKQTHIKALLTEVIVKNQYILPSSAEDRKQEKCAVLNCPSHISQIPFIPFPNKLRLVKKWWKHIKLSPSMVKERLKSGLFLSICCQHFDVQYDVLNYNEWISGLEPAQVDERAFPRFNVGFKKYVACFVPKCYNVSLQNLIFFDVPQLWEPRAKWFEAVGRSEVDMEPRFCCEDHFDMENDIITTLTSVSVVYGVVPRHKFQIAKELELKRIALEELRIKKLKEDKIIQFKTEPLEDYWNSGNKFFTIETLENSIEKIEVLTDDELKQMFLLSLLTDLKEMSFSQLEFFKLEVVRIIKSIRS